MEIESHYKKTAEVKESRLKVEYLAVKILFTVLTSYWGFLLSQFVISAMLNRWDIIPGQFAFTKTEIIPTLMGLLLGPLLTILINKHSSHPKFMNSVTGLFKKDWKSSSKILYGNFHVGKSSFHASSEAKFPNNPLLNPYKIEEKLDRKKMHYILTQELTETPLGIWKKTMEAIENENQK